ncbi:hypothetical protein K2M58_00125 [Hydrogenibacillus sp. N12]|nr:hypothetical protein K2M58_00125 [Hydrogenibacillus sp. N12]
MAAYRRSEPPAVAGWPPWTFWQYDDRETVPCHTSFRLDRYESDVVSFCQRQKARETNQIHPGSIPFKVQSGFGTDQRRKNARRTLPGIRRSSEPPLEGKAYPPGKRR